MLYKLLHLTIVIPALRLRQYFSKALPLNPRTINLQGGTMQDDRSTLYSASPKIWEKKSMDDIQSDAFTKKSWRERAPAAESSDDQPTSTPDDGFTMVANTKGNFRPRANRQKAASVLSPRVSNAPPSAAAASRSNIYASRDKQSSTFLKQSALPLHLRDPALLAAEQNKGRRIAKELYKPGMIIRAAVHEQHLDDAIGKTDKNKTESKFGAIHTKIRKMLVIALYQDHYVALPIFTHNGNGLSNKAKPDEFVSVKDHRSKAAFTNLSKHQALVTETVNDGIDLIHPKSTAHLTYPICRKFDLPVVQEGHLEKASIKSLTELYNRLAPKISQV
ncbi:MAG: hypothetical protein M1830_003178 [Pleopsidium flavum]|nr:MAG: hypothetical protein M1830_003178 [Pleopsidium flavum]